MYIPKKHKNLSTEAALSFAQKYSFATVVAVLNEQIEVVHIPLEFSKKEGKNFLTGHVAKGNKLSRAIQDGSPVTCIFSEPHSYISSSWYDHINVPTWNYIAVHAKGRFRIQEGKELLASLKQMVDHYEEGRPQRYNMSDMPHCKIKSF